MKLITCPYWKSEIDRNNPAGENPALWNNGMSLDDIHIYHYQNDCWDWIVEIFQNNPDIENRCLKWLINGPDEETPAP